MKIALFADSYLPYLSGVTIAVNTLFEDLRQLGHDVKLFVPNYPGAQIEKNVFRFPSLPSPYSGFRLTVPFAPGFTKTLKDFSPQVIHSHTPFQLGIRAQRLAKGLGIPYVYTLHTLFEEYVHYVPFVNHWHLARLLRRHLKNFCSHCSHVITPSPQTDAYYRSLNTLAPSSVIHTGINLRLAGERRGAGVREKYGIPKDAFLLIYSGRLAKEKNLPFLLRVLSQLVANEAGNQIYLLIVAGGPEEQNLQTLAAQLGLAGRIVFTHGVPHAEVFDCCAAGDLFVFASKTETQGLVIAEAKVMGLPAVVVNAEGVAASISDGEDGFLVPEDETVFADKVIGLMRNRDILIKMGAAARFNGEKKFSSVAAAKEMEKVYLGLVG
ncbi:MAG: glycosyltransferase [Candidatus Margulisiibacteriota bacterium]